jgi:ribosomal protein S18 acetylase RimI-like enzyme
MLRNANASDASAISATLREAFAEFEALYTPAAFRATTPTTDQIQSRMAEGPVWVAERNGQVVGTVSAVPRGGELYIRSMAVRPAARGEGIATHLLQAVESFAIARQYRRLVLTTTPFLTAALQLYEREGFRLTGERSDLHGTPLLTMAKELGPGVLEQAAMSRPQR